MSSIVLRRSLSSMLMLRGIIILINSMDTFTRSRGSSSMKSCMMRESASPSGMVLCALSHFSIMLFASEVILFGVPAFRPPVFSFLFFPISEVKR